MYKFIRNIIFLLEAERAHYFSMNIFSFLCSIPFVDKLMQNIFQPINKETQFLNLTFKNNIGLAAGFDKNARYLNALQTIGFGHVEIGTVTPLPQDGNEKPRLFRLKKELALINRMGFNNDGVDAVVENLKKFASKKQMVIGGNIGKNKITPNENAVSDYLICFEKLYDYVDYFVVNISSPNTPGLRDLQNEKFLIELFNQLEIFRREQKVRKPILLKIAPDLSTDDLLNIINCCEKLPMDGWVSSNTTIDRTVLKSETKDYGAGGLSGKPIFDKSNEILKLLKSHTQKPIIASGGIFTKVDVDAKIKLGANLCQIWTGFIYEGPSIVKRLV